MGLHGGHTAHNLYEQRQERQVGRVAKHLHKLTLENNIAFHQSSRARHVQGSLSFWEAHALYWAERGNMTKADECREEAADCRRELRALQ